MKAVILAAGQGTRLKKYTDGLPKGMLVVDGKTIIERQIELYTSVGINEVIIVRGYAKDKIKYDKVKYYDNENYENTNMVESLLCAKAEFDDDCIVSYSDILFEKNMLEIMVKSEGDFLVAVDDDWKYYWQARYDKVDFDTESLIIDMNNEILELGKENPSIDSIDSRYIGLLKFSEEGLKKINDLMEDSYEKYNNGKPWQQSGKPIKKAYMTDLLNALIESKEKIRAVRFNNGWIEFDTNEDYERINKLIELKMISTSNFKFIYSNMPANKTNHVRFSFITSVFNRKEGIKSLYESLLKQDEFDFEWIILENGSDNPAKEYVLDFIQQPIKFKIRYIFGEDVGLFKAQQRLISFAEGDFFIIIGSADKLIENIMAKTKKISYKVSDEKYYGFTMQRKNECFDILSKHRFPKDEIQMNYVQEVAKYGIEGEKNRFIKTTYVSGVDFELDKDTYFYPAALFYLKLCENYTTLVFNDVFTTHIYLTNGLSRNINKLYVDNPKGMYARYAKQANLVFHIKSTALSIMYGINSKYSLRKIVKDSNKKMLIGIMYIPVYIINLYWKYSKTFIYDLRTKDETLK